MHSVFDGQYTGQRVRILRRQQGLTQRELARKAGCSTSLVSRVEQGRGCMTVTTFLNLCRALACPPSALLK